MTANSTFHFNDTANHRDAKTTPKKGTGESGGAIRRGIHYAKITSPRTDSRGADGV